MADHGQCQRVSLNGRRCMRRIKRKGSRYCSVACSNVARTVAKRKSTPKSAKDKIRKFSVRDQQIIAGVLAGKSQTQSAVEAGCKPTSASTIASQVLGKPEVKLTILEILEEKGITDGYLADHLREGLEATKTVSMVPMKGSTGGDLPDAGGSSVEFVDVPDFGNRNKYFKDALMLRGHLKDAPVQAPNLQVNIAIKKPATEKEQYRSEVYADASEVEPNGNGQPRINISIKEA